MSATETLRQDHIQIKRLKKIIIKCYTKLYAGENIPLSDIEQITIIMAEFLDAIHYSREEDAYFACVAGYDSLKKEIRAFMIEHEFGRRIAKSVMSHLKQWKEGKDSREPVARFLRTYAIYLNDHITKEEQFFDIAEKQILSPEEEKEMYEEFRAVNAVITKLDEMVKSINSLEEKSWMK
ncbi:MAG TPA: hemerythrin domain-containing protein, partial [Nitrosopumilaceae archaeon]|nr:hemerythrin domain-containing protein [Nitrosopumilaceae archaeon]